MATQTFPRPRDRDFTYTNLGGDVVVNIQFSAGKLIVLFFIGVDVAENLQYSAVFDVFYGPMFTKMWILKYGNMGSLGHQKVFYLRDGRFKRG